MSAYAPTEKATPIRYPSTANLMLDSADRPTVLDASGINIITPWDFQISRPNSIMNGFFTRIATTEVVLEWCQPNITGPGRSIAFDISGYGTPVGFNLLPGQYDVEDTLTTIVQKYNDLSGTTGSSVKIQASQGQVGLVFAPNPVLVQGITGTTWAGRGLVQMLNLIPGLPLPDGKSLVWFVQCPDLRPYRYIDFVSPDLTYAQELKDTNTTTYPKDVLCRWYFSDDVPEQVDGLGFPILMGYRRFCRRRLYNPPKQIRWDSNLPIGNMRFQVYDEDNQLVRDPRDFGLLPGTTNWLMTLQVSEI